VQLQVTDGENPQLLPYTLLGPEGGAP